MSPDLRAVGHHSAGTRRRIQNAQVCTFGRRKLFSDITRDACAMSRVFHVMHGQAVNKVHTPQGEESAYASVDKVRLILPQCSMMSLIDILLASRLHMVIDTAIAILGSCVMGARPKTQILDTPHAKGALGRGGFGLVLRPFTGPQDRIRDKGHGALAATVLRRQIFSSLYVSLASGSKICIRNGAKGGLTDSSSAGAMVRIPVEHTMADREHDCRQCGFSKQVSTASFVDNIFAFDNSPHKQLHGFFMIALTIYCRCEGCA